MSTAVSIDEATRANAARVPLHGRMHAWRRRAITWILRRALPPARNLVREGELPVAGIQRVLICRPNHRLGNTVMLTALMSEIENRFPGAEVDVLGSGGATRSVFGGFDCLGELFLLDRRALRHPLATISTLRKLRAKRYDLVVDAAAGSSSGRIAANLARAVRGDGHGAEHRAR